MNDALLFEKLTLGELSEEWQCEWDSLMRDPWLRRKIDRRRRLREHLDFLRTYAPHLWDCEPGLVIDLGPGPGETLEIARALGHFEVGIDAARGFGGMGDEYLRASMIRVQQQGLAVGYVDALSASEDVMRGVSIVNDSTRNAMLLDGGHAVLVNSRGSIEQVFSEFMEGRPHHVHHNAEDMAWRLSDSLTEQAMRDLMRFACHELRPDGLFVCRLNGSSNTAQAEVLLDVHAVRAGLHCVKSEPLLHIWARRSHDASEEQ
jgi:hypothetical protein